MIVINEYAVYKLVFRSNKPEADAFTNWVASEVLPSIRRTGVYAAKKAQKYLRDGKTAEWVEQRQEGVETRKCFTTVLKDHGVAGVGYAQCTDAINRPVLGGSAIAVRARLGLSQGQTFGIASRPQNWFAFNLPNRSHLPELKPTTFKAMILVSKHVAYLVKPSPVQFNQHLKTIWILRPKRDVALKCSLSLWTTEKAFKATKPRAGLDASGTIGGDVSRWLCEQSHTVQQFFKIEFQGFSRFTLVGG
jgi:hypothetical protein